MVHSPLSKEQSLHPSSPWPNIGSLRTKIEKDMSGDEKLMVPVQIVDKDVPCPFVPCPFEDWAMMSRAM